MRAWERTDLAAEAFDGRDGAEAAADEAWETAAGPVTVSRLRIVTDAAAERLGRGRGEYVTVTTRPFSSYEEDELGELSAILARELTALAPPPAGGVLVVGLGNRELTADALGPLTALRVPATRHFSRAAPRLFEASGAREISVLAPGASGQTGIETSELVRGAVRAVAPSLVVAVDALAARSRARLGTTVQLSDAGIRPGSGIGNARSELSRRTLGVPVLSVGVPTVVAASVMTAEALEAAGLDPAEARFSGLYGADDFFVSPKDCDVIADRAARAIAGALCAAYSHK